MSVTIHTTVKQISSTTSQGEARGHVCLVDRPQAKGGTDRGPMGGELMLMGIGGCFLSNLLAGVRAAGVSVDDLSVAVSAELDGVRFSDIRLTVSTACADKAALAPLVAEAEARCISINTAKAATAVTVALA